MLQNIPLLRRQKVEEEMIAPQPSNVEVQCC